MKNIQEFMFLFKIEVEAQHPLTSDEMSGIKKRWKTWIGQLALDARVVNSYQLGTISTYISSQKVSNMRLKEGCKTVTGSMVISAKNTEEAVDLAQDCPIIDMGGLVEIRTIITS